MVLKKPVKAQCQVVVDQDSSSFLGCAGSKSEWKKMGLVLFSTLVMRVTNSRRLMVENILFFARMSALAWTRESFGFWAFLLVK
jgi:hypothetical protein